jgi:hypothetical protein
MVNSQASAVAPRPVVEIEPRTAGGDMSVRLEQLFGRLEPLRLMTLGGLTGPSDATDAALLFERIADDVASAFPTRSAEIAKLRQDFKRVPAIRDLDRRLTKARSLVDGLTACLVAIEADLIASHSMGQRRRPARNFVTWIVLGAALCVALAARLAYEPVFMGRIVFPLYAQRLADMSALHEAVESYHRDHGVFPLSAEGGAKWNGVARSGDPKQWIPGLAPAYIATLPRDPRENDNPYNQFVYKSDGADYKLLALVPEDCSFAIKRHPALSDPARNVFKQCYAYGYWSPGAVTW